METYGEVSGSAGGQKNMYRRRPDEGRSTRAKGASLEKSGAIERVCDGGANEGVFSEEGSCNPLPPRNICK